MSEKKFLIALIFVFLTVALRCDSGGEEAEDEALSAEDAALLGVLLVSSSQSTAVAQAASATPSLSYTTSGTTYPVNTAIQTNSATVTSSNSATVTASSFSVSPTLPTGLSLSTSTGAITGTPTANQALTTYTVTVIATNGRTGTRQISIGVVASAASVTCNTVGTAAGCSAGSPFSCTNSSFCYTSVSACRAASSCNYYL